MSQQSAKIRDLMPENYGNILQQRTGRSRVYIYNVVNQERTTTPIWPAVLELAEETIRERKKSKKRLQKLREAA